MRTVEKKEIELWLSMVLWGLRLESGRLSRLWRAVCRRERLLRRAGEIVPSNPKV